jgi:hypothetical protein
METLSLVGARLTSPLRGPIRRGAAGLVNRAPTNDSAPDERSAPTRLLLKRTIGYGVEREGQQGDVVSSVKAK